MMMMTSNEPQSVGSPCLQKSKLICDSIVVFPEPIDDDDDDDVVVDDSNSNSNNDDDGYKSSVRIMSSL